MEVVAIEANSTMMDLYMLHQVCCLKLPRPVMWHDYHLVVTHWNSCRFSKFVGPGCPAIAADL